MKRYILLFIVLVPSIYGSDYASYSGAFLRMGTSARSLSMGSGFTAEIDQGFAAYHNPATLAFIDKKQVGFSYHSLNLDRRLMMSSVSSNLPPTAGLGVAWISSGVDNIPVSYAHLTLQTNREV